MSKLKVELDCHMEFSYDEDYRDVVFGYVDFAIMIPRELEEKFKSVDYKEWDRLVEDMINKRILEGDTLLRR